MMRKLVAVSLLTLATGHVFAAECKATVESTDQMTFNTKAIEVDKRCKTFTVELKHVGSLPKNVMGHNWVLTRLDDVDDVAKDGMSAGIDKDYVKEGDTRVLAHTKIIGGGETDTVTFDVAKLDPAEKYEFFCSFPAHHSLMKGTVTLK